MLTEYNILTKDVNESKLKIKCLEIYKFILLEIKKNFFNTKIKNTWKI